MVLINCYFSYIGLISIENSQVRTKALQQMLSYLVHAFPRVNNNRLK